MPQFSRALDVYQGFNFKKDKQTPVGYITAITIGDQALTADQETIKDPEQPANNLSAKVVAVLNNYLWETGVTDTMYFSGQISTANKQLLAQLILGSFANITVTFNYVIYEYDPLAKKYFKSNYVDAVLNGLLEKNGDELNVAVARVRAALPAALFLIVRGRHRPLSLVPTWGGCLPSPRGAYLHLP